MDIPLHPTDRIIKRSKFYILRKKYLRPPYIVFLVFVLGILITKYLLTEVPPKNVINHTRYGRNTVNIHLIPESVTINPVYEFGKLSENQYFLDIHDSHIRFESERNYDYGAISKIEYHRLDSKKTRITFTFSLLKDDPEIAYIQDPPHFQIHFNRYLDNKFIVVIDPGHGGDNTGAIGPKGTIEKDITLGIALYLKRYLSRRKDVEIFLTRDKDTYVSLFARRRLSNFWDSDLFLSIHANYAPNKQVNQSEIYYTSNRSLGPARIIRDELQNDLKNGRGFIRRRGFAVIRRNTARMGALLVETMYLSNAQGEKFLTVEKNQEFIANSLFNSIEKILDRAQ